MKAKTSLLALAAGLMTAVSGSAQAEYPEKPIEVIIPFGPGSNADTSGRLLLNALSNAMGGANLVPINVAGAGGTVGAAQASGAANDGYGIIYAPIATMTIQPHLRNVPYDNTKFEGVCMVMSNPVGMQVHPDSPHNSVDDVIAAANAGEQVVAVGPAPGSMPHITQAAIANAYGAEFIYLPAGGGGKAAAAVMSGEATFAADQYAMESVHGVKTLAIAAEERMDGLPDVPTFKELGKDVVVQIWLGLFAPAGTPDDVLETLSDACGKASEDDEYRQAMASSNYNVRYMPRADFHDYYQSQFTDNKAMLNVIGVKLDK